MNELAIETLLEQTHGGAEGSVTPPIYQSSLFTFDDFAAFEARMSQPDAVFPCADPDGRRLRTDDGPVGKRCGGGGRDFLDDLCACPTR